MAGKGQVIRFGVHSGTAAAVYTQTLISNKMGRQPSTAIVLSDHESSAAVQRVQLPREKGSQDLNDVCSAIRLPLSLLVLVNIRATPKTYEL